MNLPHNHDKNINRVLDNMPGNNKFADCAELFSQLGDPTRLKILWILCHSKECVSDIAAAVGMSRAVVSHHLQLLRKSDLVNAERVGQEIHYSLAASQEAKLLHQTIEAFFKITCPVIDS